MAVGEQTGCAAAPVVSASAPQISLVVQNGTQKGTRLHCRHVITLIGTRTGCKFRLPHDRVAPVHAAIFHDGKTVRAIDLLSPSGTYLNELKVEQEKLSAGDKLEIGPWNLLVEVVTPPRNGTHQGDALDLEPTPRVVALEHVDTGRVLQPNREVCLIGRKQGCDIVVDSPDVSRVHALLINYNDRPAIVDLLSSNGTRVNHERVNFQTLSDGDVIDIGESLFRVRIIGSSVGEKPSRRSAGGNGAAQKNGKAALSELDNPESTAKPSANGRSIEDEVLELDMTDTPEPDLISIESVESAQRWRIADDLAKLEKASRS